MKKGNLWAAALCVLLITAVLALTPAHAAQYTQNGFGEPVAERNAAVMTLPQTDGIHAGYMPVGEWGLFQPEAVLSRGELAQMLYAVTLDRLDSRPVFYDVPENAWYALAVETVAGLGLMTGGDGWFRPEAPATRAECAYALSRLLPYDAPMVDLFPDVWPGDWAYDAICRTAGLGLFVGDNEGCFRSGDGLRRCEAAVVFNRLLGRCPDRQALDGLTGSNPFIDVPSTHWAYAEIMEATVTHQCEAAENGTERWTWPVPEVWVVQETSVEAEHWETDDVSESPEPAAETEFREAAGRPDGPQRIDGHLYWVVDERFVRGCGMNGLRFDGNGWYTTGDEELDGLLNALVEELTDASMTREEQLRVLFDHVVENYTYLARPLVDKDDEGWEPEYAKFFLQNGKGNCYSFAAAYCLLSRELGLMAYPVVGTSGGRPHGWVEIPLDGETYMFDPELQWYYNNRTDKSYDLFKMLPTEIPSGVYRYGW